MKSNGRPSQRPVYLDNSKQQYSYTFFRQLAVSCRQSIESKKPLRIKKIFENKNFFLHFEPFVIKSKCYYGFSERGERR